MKKYIIGMAKSGLDKKSGKIRSLLADFEQLANFVKNDEKVAMAYLLVFDESIKELVSSWFIKNGVTENQLKILVANDHPLFNEDEVRAEKSRNARGITPNREPGDSVADISKNMFEEILADKILQIYNCDNITSSNPIGTISWDFVGEIK
jgi:hypothetical protein